MRSAPPRLHALPHKLGVPIVHLSTDYVFDGALDRPYREDDPTGPIGEYTAAPSSLGNRPWRLRTQITRSCGPPGSTARSAENFVRTMLNLAATREEISVVADQHGAPTSAHDIADGVIKVARNLEGSAAPNLRGVFHIIAQGEATWAEFAEAIFALSRDAGGPFARVKPIPTSDYPTPARRPANSRLDTAKIARETWRDFAALARGARGLHGASGPGRIQESIIDGDHQGHRASPEGAARDCTP